MMICGDTLDLFGFEAKSLHSATWQRGSYECRNYHGYFQSREVGSKDWQFCIYGFSDFGTNRCSVAIITTDGKMGESTEHITDKNHLVINGKKYPPHLWDH